MISFDCSGCKCNYKVPEEYAGKRVRCKKCNAITEIPIDELEDSDFLFADEDDEETQH